MAGKALDISWIRVYLGYSAILLPIKYTLSALHCRTG